MFIDTDGPPDGSTDPNPAKPAPTKHRTARVPASTLNFLGNDAEQRHALDSIATALARAQAQAQKNKPQHRAPAAANLAAAIDQVQLNNPTGSLEATLEELRPLWLDHAIHYDSPTYLAHLNCPIAVESFAGDVLATGMNTAVESWDQARSAALIEDRLIRWAAEQAGMDPHHASGTFTSGGTQSNHQALYTAREKALHRNPGAKLEDLAVICSTQAHYSIARSAHILGLNSENVITVPTDQMDRMDPEALKSTLNDLPAQLIPMAIVATAGTTDLGAIDPLATIAHIARTARTAPTHLHVDCAYGGALLLSPTRRHLLDGLHLADSFTLDFHKSFFQPVACSALIYRNQDDLQHVTWHAEYLNAHHDPRLNLADRSLQTTRRFDALKLWITLRTTGATNIGEAFDACCDLATQAAELIAAQPDFTLLQAPQLSTVLFRYSPPGVDADRINPLIRRRLFDSNQAIIAGTVHDNRPYLKFTLLNPQLGAREIDHVLHLIRETGHTLVKENA